MPLPRSVLLLLLAGCCGPAAAFPLPALDRHGDPLPTGAVARLGTSRLRAGADSMHFSADGKALVGTSANRAISVWDAGTGLLLDTRPFPGQAPQAWNRSADGRTLVAGRDKWLELIDVATGRSLGGHRPKLDGFVHRMAVSDDRRWVLFSEPVGDDDPAGVAGGIVLVKSVEHLIVWDTVVGMRRTLTKDESDVTAVAFSPGSNRAVSSSRIATRVWDTATGKKLWEVRGSNAEECHFTPDGKYLIAAPGGGQTRWHIWEADTGKPAKELHPPTVGYAWSFAVSPDGTQLVIPTDTDYVLWDLKAGAVKHRWPGANQRGRGTFAPDGRSVVTHDTILRRWDLATGKNLYANVSGHGHVATVRRVFFTPDGKRAISVGDDRTARVWDVATSRLLRTVPIESTIDVWAMAPDGSALIGVDGRLTVHRWPVAADGPKSAADLREAQRLNIGLQPQEAHVLPDGTLALLAWPKAPEYQFHRFSFSFWDPATGRLIRWGGDPGNDYRADYVRLAPDGRVAASSEAAFDARTGARRGLPATPFGLGSTPVFSPDGRLLAATSRDTRVWELATGRVLTDLPGGSTERAAFSSDGRRLAFAQPDRLVVWDVALRKPVAEWPVPDGEDPLAPAGVRTLTFAPDGRTLATGHADGTILFWPVPQPVPDGRWSEADAAAAWDTLVEDNPVNAYPAVWQLADYPAEVVRFLRGKFALAPAADADEWPKLIAGLDSPRFAEREAASKRVRELGRAAEDPLRQALRQGPSPEQVARIEALLAALDPPARLRGDDLRAVRAVAVLEMCGTPDARRLLAEWAERGTPPRLSDEAARAVGRLKHRP